MPRPHRLVLTIPQLWVFLAIALPVLAALIASLSAIDLAYQVRAGQLMLDRGSILMTDPFTFTVGGSRWVDQQWASQVLLAGVFGVAGWPGLAVLRAILARARGSPAARASHARRSACRSRSRTTDRVRRAST